jgi:hypothetical protein
MDRESTENTAKEAKQNPSQHQPECVRQCVSSCALQVVQVHITVSKEAIPTHNKVETQQASRRSKTDGN